MGDNDAPTAEQKEQLDEKVEKVLKGLEVLNTVKDGAELIGLLEAAGEAGAGAAAAVEAAAVLSPILALVAGLYGLLQADMTEEKLAGARGFSYGVTWGVLGKGTPHATCGGPNELFPDRVESEQQKWDAGAKEGVSKGDEPEFKNRCILWMAKNNDNGDALLRHFFSDAGSHLGLSDGQLNDLSSNMTVDSPVC